MDKLKLLLKRISDFNEDRDWNKFHTPSNLAKSISIEAAELLECFQWDDERFNRENVVEELADIMNYCLQMTQVLNVDIVDIINQKKSIPYNIHQSTNLNNSSLVPLLLIIFGIFYGFQSMSDNFSTKLEKMDVIATMTHNDIRRESKEEVNTFITETKNEMTKIIKEARNNIKAFWC